MRSTDQLWDVLRRDKAPSTDDPRSVPDAKRQLQGDEPKRLVKPHEVAAVSKVASRHTTPQDRGGLIDRDPVVLERHWLIFAVQELVEEGALSRPMRFR
jgi:hypothetical protein